MSAVGGRRVRGPYVHRSRDDAVWRMARTRVTERWFVDSMLRGLLRRLTYRFARCFVVDGLIVDGWCNDLGAALMFDRPEAERVIEYLRGNGIPVFVLGMEHLEYPLIDVVEEIEEFFVGLEFRAEELGSSEGAEVMEGVS